MKMMKTGYALPIGVLFLAAACAPDRPTAPQPTDVDLFPSFSVLGVPLNAGDVVVVDHANGDLGNPSLGIHRLDRSTGVITPISTGGLFRFPYAAVVDARGHVLVTDPGASAVIDVDPVTGAQSFRTTGLSSPFGLALEADGNLIVGNVGAGANLTRVDAAGVQTLLADGGPLRWPISVEVESDGQIIHADQTAVTGNGAVIRVDPVTGAQSVVSSGGVFGCPSSIAIEADGNVLVTTARSCGGLGAGLVRVDPSSGTQTVVATGGLFSEGGTGMVVEADGGILIVDGRHFGVILVDPVTGVQTEVVPAGVFAQVAGLALVTVTTVPVLMDIKPGSDPNSVNTTSKGAIPVAILTTTSFDAADVAASTVTLGDDDGTDTPVATRKNGSLRATLEDVDGDGDLDMILHFDTQALVANGDLTTGTTELILNGENLAGTPIKGSDAVRVVR